MQFAFECLQLVVEFQTLDHGDVIELRVRVCAQAAAESSEGLEALRGFLQQRLILCHQAGWNSVLQDVIVSEKNKNKAQL